MRKIILAAFLVCSLSSQAQLGGLLNKAKGKGGKLELFPEEKIAIDAATKYAGQIVFSNEELERNLSESKYINSYTLGDKLSLRAWLVNSPANSMMVQLQESGIKAREINEAKDSFDGQSQVMLFMSLDGNRVANTSYAWDNDQKDMLGTPTVRADINDGTDKNYFGESLYKSLLEKEELLTPGKHKLKIELVPRKKFGLGKDFDFKPIAMGELELIIPAQLKIGENDCFPKSAMSDPKLEAEVLKACKIAFKENAANAIKAILTHGDIFIVRGDYNVIIKKTFMAAIACKNSKGEVWYDYYVFDKMYDGSKYLPTVLSKEITVDGRATPSGRKVNKECLKFLK